MNTRPKSVGAAAAIHAARARKVQEELTRIEGLLDVAKVGEGETVAGRVEAALLELARLRRTVEDLEWELAGGPKS